MASSRFVRQSKVRHVYGDQWKPEQCFSELRLATATGDQSYIKVNSQFFAVAVRGGGGPLLVHPLSGAGRVSHDAPVLSGHKGNVIDFDFNPFNDHMIASGADDCTIKIWGIPEGGLTENVTEPLNELLGHDRKVGFVLFHPTASNVLASASADHTVRIWDVEEGETKITLSDFSDQIQDLKWNHNGSTIATTCRDKQLRIHDVRASAIAQQVEAHEGGKAFKTTFLGDTGRMVTVGFTKQSKRQIKLWDSRDLTTAITTVDIDQSAGTILPFYDQATDLLYLAGKGDNNIRYYEVVNEAPYFHLINSVRTPSSAKGSALLPKRAVDVSKNEIARFVRLGSRGTVDVVSMICPRKSDHFQSDLYPPAPSAVPALDAAAWFGGADAEPKTVSMEPGAAASGASGAGAGAGSPMKSRAQLQKELTAANSRIRELEAELEALKA